MHICYCDTYHAGQVQLQQLDLYVCKRLRTSEGRNHRKQRSSGGHVQVGTATRVCPSSAIPLLNLQLRRPFAKKCICISVQPCWSMDVKLALMYRKSSLWFGLKSITTRKHLQTFLDERPFLGDGSNKQ